MAWASPEKEREYKQQWRARKIESYLSAHGCPPLCECGCGALVNFNSNGQPSRFLRGHASRIGVTGFKAVNESRARERVDIVKFREGMQRIRQKRGWTLKEMAEFLGMTENHLCRLLYGDQRSVTRKLAVRCLRRLNGEATEATALEQRIAVADARRRGADRKARSRGTDPDEI